MQRKRVVTRRPMRRRGRGSAPRVQSTFGRHAPSRPLSGQMKVYTFDFTLSPQIVSASHTAPATVVLGSNGYSALKPISSVLSLPSSSAPAFGAAFCDWSFACAHRMSDLINSSPFATQYDAYRINDVTMIVEYMTNAATPGTVTTLPTFYYVYDQDDSAVPLNPQSLYGKQGVQSWQPNASSTTLAFKYKPRISVYGNGDLVAPNLVGKPGQWVNCSDINTIHHAVKACATDFYAPGSQNFSHGFRIQFKYSISFRSPLICF